MIVYNVICMRVINMSKKEMIDYLKKIKPYINLRSVCNMYNKSHFDNSIDYNNLRVVINETSITRLSEDKLHSFILFLFNELYIDIFECDKATISISEKRIEMIIRDHVENMKKEIMEEIINGI